MLYIFTIVFYKHLKILKRVDLDHCNFKPEKLYYDFYACVEEQIIICSVLYTRLQEKDSGAVTC